ncbi:hypothetical protein [Enterobacter cloacae]
MIGNTLQLPGKSVNSLTAKVNGANFAATIIGGRYDEGPGGVPEWIRRSWGRGPLHPEDKTHVLVFISINWDISGEQTYNLADSNLPVSIGFTNLFPADDGDENQYLVYAKKGTLTITHSKVTFIAEGSFDFEVDIPNQPDGSTLSFRITDGKFYVGPSDKLISR